MYLITWKWNLDIGTVIDKCNCYFRVTSVDISEDSSLVSAGFADSTIRVFSITPNKLRSMKPADELNLIDREAGKDAYSHVHNC